MHDFECRCPRCEGAAEEDPGRGPDCMQCGAPVISGDAYWHGPEGLLHAECAADYAFLDTTRDELLEFAEQHLNDFIPYVTDLRNFRAGSVRKEGFV